MLLSRSFLSCRISLFFSVSTFDLSPVVVISNQSTLIRLTIRQSFNRIRKCCHRFISLNSLKTKSEFLEHTTQCPAAGSRAAKRCETQNSLSNWLLIQIRRRVRWSKWRAHNLCHNQPWPAHHLSLFCLCCLKRPFIIITITSRLRTFTISNSSNRCNTGQILRHLPLP